MITQCFNMAHTNHFHIQTSMISSSVFVGISFCHIVPKRIPTVYQSINQMNVLKKWMIFYFLIKNQLIRSFIHFIQFDWMLMIITMLMMMMKQYFSILTVSLRWSWIDIGKNIIIIVVVFAVVVVVLVVVVVVHLIHSVTFFPGKQLTFFFSQKSEKSKIFCWSCYMFFVSFE